MNKNIQDLENHLNFIWEIIPNQPTYGEFNKIFPANENIDILRNFEKENNWFGIANYNKKEEGISIISLLSSITDYFTDGYRLAVVVESNDKIKKNDQKIVGFKFIKI